MEREAIKALAPSLLPKRARVSSKHDYGRLLIVGGSTGFSGAPTLASRAAVRGGAGLVHLAVPESIYTVAAVKNDEAMVIPLPCDAEGRISAGCFDALEWALPKCNAVAVGPGLGKSDDLIRVVKGIGERANGMLVLDADALWAVSQLGAEFTRGLRCGSVMTPHSGEFKNYLSGRTDLPRAEAAAEAAERYGSVIVLKGNETVVAFPDGKIYVNHTGNPGLARGGSGDALTGILGAMLCQFEPDKAVPLGVFLHGLAGDLAAEDKGEYGMNIMDVIDFLPRAMKLIAEE